MARHDRSTGEAGDTLQLTVEPTAPESVCALRDGRSGEGVVAHEAWHTWGSSIVTSDDGTYHMFYARWPKALGFGAWLTHSEVAHAVSTGPEGPYRFVDTALSCRGPYRWNAVTAHNPKIKRFGSLYYLYYISTRGDDAAMDENELIFLGGASARQARRWMLRTNQRTGVAWSESPDGPWTSSDAPIVEPAGPIATLTVNPAVCRSPDGTYLMIVKGDKPGETRFVRNQAIATARGPLGPFAIADRPVIDYLDTEDASMWYDSVRGGFYAVFHAEGRIGMLWSPDGLAWEPAAQETLTPKEITLTDGSTFKPDRMERPFILTNEEGTATHLFVAVKAGEATANLALRLAEA